MKLTILTTITNPEERQDKWLEALNCYAALADEIIVVNGDRSYGTVVPKVQFVNLEWPEEWNWIELPKHLNAGLEKATGDWVLKLDIDQLFHEKDIDNIHSHLLAASNCPVATFSKFTVVSPTRMFQKGQIPIAINRKFKNICFGESASQETDLCYPILQESTREVDGYDLPVGKAVSLEYKTGIAFYNYDYFFKEPEFALQEFERFNRAYQRFYHKQKFSKDSFWGLREGYKLRATHEMSLKDHPQWIRPAVEEVVKKKLNVVANK